MSQKEQELLVSELETRLDRLRQLYDQYFLGFEKLEPTVPKKDVERRIDQLRKEQIRNTALRFRFNVTAQKYNTYQTLWGRTCRQIEEGTFKRHVQRAKSKFGRDPTKGTEVEVDFDIDLSDLDDLESDVARDMAEMEHETTDVSGRRPAVERPRNAPVHTISDEDDDDLDGETVRPPAPPSFDSDAAGPRREQQRVAIPKGARVPQIAPLRGGPAAGPPSDSGQRAAARRGGDGRDTDPSELAERQASPPPRAPEVRRVVRPAPGTERERTNPGAPRERTNPGAPRSSPGAPPERTNPGAPPERTNPGAPRERTNPGAPRSSPAERTNPGAPPSSPTERTSPGVERTSPGARPAIRPINPGGPPPSGGRMPAARPAVGSQPDLTPRPAAAPRAPGAPSQGRIVARPPPNQGATGPSSARMPAAPARAPAPASSPRVPPAPPTDDGPDSGSAKVRGPAAPTKPPPPLPSQIAGRKPQKP